MGVQGLWQLLDPIGRPVNFEVLEGKVLAVDVSIWIHQAIKGYRDSEGQSVANAHLLSLFQRICKLLFCKIKPIFVFDGGIPAVKKREIMARAERRREAEHSMARNAKRILNNFVKQHYLGVRSYRLPPNPKFKMLEELFKLPELPQGVLDDPYAYDAFEEEDDLEDTSWLPDVESKEFSQLPPELRHRTLNVLKEKEKRLPPDRVDDMPEQSDEFSLYQMKKVLKKRQLQQKIEETETEMKRSRFVDTDEVCSFERIASDDTTHIVLYRRKTTAKTAACVKPVANLPASLHNQEIHSKQGVVIKIEQDTMHNQSADNAVVTLEDRSLVTDWLNAAMKGNAIEGAVVDKENDHVEKVDDSTIKPQINTNLSQTITKIKLVNKEIQIDVMDNGRKDENDLEHCLTVGNKLAPVTSIEESQSLTLARRNLDDLNDIPVVSTETKKHIEEIAQDEQRNTVDDDGIGNSTNLNVSLAAHENDYSIDVKNVDNDNLAVDNKSSSINEPIDEQPSTSMSFREPTSPPRRFESLEEEIGRLERDQNVLLQEQMRIERQTANVTDTMIEECQKLIQLFGIPYLVSPMEAEAQCAVLDFLELTQGTITDDSDIWLFGGRKVYRHFFSTEQQVELFDSRQIEIHFGLTREDLIAFAMLTGSDYCHGIEGVGPVNAVEIISEFRHSSALETLRSFKDWLLKARSDKALPTSSTRSKFAKFEVEESFPSDIVYQAYIEPEVDSSKEKFSWATPDLDGLRAFAAHKLNWTREKVDSFLLPVLKKLSERQSQSRIDTYLVATGNKRENLFPSKRMTKAVQRIASSSPQKKQNKSLKVQSSTVRTKEAQLSEDSDSSQD